MAGRLGGDPAASVGTDLVTHAGARGDDVLAAVRAAGVARTVPAGRAAGVAGAADKGAVLVAAGDERPVVDAAAAGVQALLLALPVLADLVRGAAVLEARALARARLGVLGLALGAGDRIASGHATPARALLPDRARGAAAAAVGRVGAGVDARAAAVCPGGANAGAALACLVGSARGAARPAVGRVGGGVDAAPTPAPAPRRSPPACWRRPVVRRGLPNPTAPGRARVRTAKRGRWIRRFRRHRSRAWLPRPPARRQRFPRDPAHRTRTTPGPAPPRPIHPSPACGPQGTTHPPW